MNFGFLIMFARQISSALLGFLFIASLAGKASSEEVAKPKTSWSGYYTGLNIGAANNQDRLNSDFSYGAYHLASSVDSNDRAIPIGGAHFGYQKSLSQWVIGAEASFDLTNAKHNECRRTFALDNPCPDHVDGTATIDDRTKQTGSIQLKVGRQLFGSLIYLTSGIVVARTETVIDVFCPEGCGRSDAVPYSSIKTYQHTLTAPIYGAGIDRKLGKHWVTGIRYQRFSLPKTSQSVDHAATYGPQQFVTSTQNTFDNLHVRLSYIF